MNCSASIVYSNSWTDQTSSVESVVILTASQASVYRVTVAGDGLQSAGGASVVATVIQATANNAVSITADITCDNPDGLTVSATGTVHLLADQTLSFSASPNAAVENYNVYVVIEQLQ